MAPPPRSDDQASFDKELGKCLKARRKDLGMSVLDIAVKSGVSHDHIYRLEQGRHTAQSNTLKAVARALKTTVEELKALAAVPGTCQPRRRRRR